MHVRKLLAGLGASAVALSVLALTASPASAVYEPHPDDTGSGTPVAAQLIGVGSDTTQHAVKVVADAYNLTSPPATIWTWAACLTPTTCGTVQLPSGDINRPNGSGAGKTLLYGAANNTDIDFARSSSANNAAETAAGLQMFPFGLDTLVMAVSGNVTSHAPAGLTPAQIVAIYKGDITNWSQIPGGTAGTIHPKTPQPGSGTRSFWDAQLTAMNGGVAVVYGAGVQEVQEHDDTDIKNDADAIAPFSAGRAGLLGSTLRLESGWSANRAVYNVVRGADVAKPEVLAAFGSNGYFCSAAAKPLIEQSGFKQLFTPSKGGVCGAATQTATSNFVVAEVPTTTTVTVTSASASSARISAAVTGSTAPSGTVAFFEGSTQIATGVPLTSGAAVRVQNASPGSHTYRAVFTPAANSPFLASEGTGTGTVEKAVSTIKSSFPKTVKFGKKAKGTVTVTLSGSSSKATGKVTIKEGKKVVGTGTLSNGKVKITLKKLSPGKHKLTISWPGDANGNASEVKIKIKGLPKPKPKN
ncbi:MAG TPA: Ig-like domain repeat protein [Nocardioides sp.]|uniref:Ig-like domain repeat protein n=1 Tax=uncultured Nocardioides sp. TaxID=198441 RepID=UPI00262CFB64|nr:Ig-like domain repeat protein [uncultured Nocardioides sp.]HRI97330.1 Ig-like domain repeat protein [Nocardioides sp.]HRK46705.1 Ig-like domain repeat protein [Nocardioides sp.]